MPLFFGRHTKKMIKKQETPEEKKAKEALETPLKEKGYDLYSLRFLSSAEGPKLEVVVDRPEPISLDDIVALSDFVSAALDEADPIAGPYTLDLSSAGAEKEIALARLPEYVGRYVHLHLSTPYQGENILEGDLVSTENGQCALTITNKGRKKQAIFPLQDVDAARLAIKF